MEESSGGVQSGSSGGFQWRRLQLGGPVEGPVAVTCQSPSDQLPCGPTGGEVVALRCVRPDRPALPAVALRGSGSGPPAEKSPQEESHRVMKAAAGDDQPSEGQPGSRSPSTAGWTESRRVLLSCCLLIVVASRRREVEVVRWNVDEIFIKIMHLRRSSSTSIIKTV